MAIFNSYVSIPEGIILIRNKFEKKNIGQIPILVRHLLYGPGHMFQSYFLPWFPGVKLNRGKGLIRIYH